MSAAETVFFCAPSSILSSLVLSVEDISPSADSVAGEYEVFESESSLSFKAVVKSLVDKSLPVTLSILLFKAAVITLFFTAFALVVLKVSSTV